MNQERIKNIRQYGKTAKGEKEILKHLSGQKLTLRQAVLAKCYDCMGYFADGKVDCHIPHCSLHPFMPYNESKIKIKTGRVMTVEHKEKIRAARRRQRNTPISLCAISNNDD
jgi:hypothetical protein